MLALLFVITLVTAAITPLSECGNARATFYADNGDDLACVLGNDYPSSIFRVAPNEKFYLGSSQCGICYEAVGEIGSVVLMVSDLCPVKGNQEHCSGDHVHFDVGQKAFPYLCKKDAGSCDITYRMVACNVEGNIRLKTKAGVSEWWLGFHVQNYVVGIKSVSISYGSVTKVLTRTSGNFWEHQAEGSAMTTPVTVTVTSITGEKQTIIMNDIVSNKIYKGNGQFSASMEKFFDPETLEEVDAPSEMDECCSIPDNTVIYHDKIESFWNVGYGTYTNDNSVKKEGSASMKFSWKQWAGMNIGTTAHVVKKNLYSAIQMYVKTTKGASFDIWHLGYGSKKKTVTASTSDWELVTVPFDALSFGDEYFKGFEVQSRASGTVTFYFDEIKLVKKEGVCFQVCSDHTSTCSTFTH